MATLVDLEHAAGPAGPVVAEICIVGAGAAGLYLANRLCRAGRRVVVLEAGGRRASSTDGLGMAPGIAANRYAGALEGRAFGWGGTTSKWGGVLVPHVASDAPEGSDHRTTWSHVVRLVAERAPAVFRTLGLRGAPDFAAPAGGFPPDCAEPFAQPGFATLAADALPFSRRNLVRLARGKGGEHLTVYLNAVATRWHAHPTPGGPGKVAAVDAVTATGRALRVTAGAFVIAAGAIECPRILLEIDQATAGAMLPRAAEIGGGLSDHLSCAIGDVIEGDRRMAAVRYGPRFVKGRMRTFRLRVTAPDQGLPRHFAHFIFDAESAGFNVARQALADLQRGSPPRVSPRHLAEGLAGLSALAYQRLIRARLHIPRGAPVHLQLDVEQIPDAANRVTLGSTLDRFGRPKAIVHWRIGDGDYRRIRDLAARLLGLWPADPRVPRLRPVAAGNPQSKPHDAYHPVGTCRMGDDERAVVDQHLRVKGTGNLYVLSTAVFPSAGSANPTFSMLCLGDRLADALAA